MSVKNYRDLIAWQRAMDLVSGVYAMVRGLPDAENYSGTYPSRK
ncbi:MAG: four helix bundle protein [Vicinamibacterales bacterium]